MEVLYLGGSQKSSWPGGEGNVAKLLRSLLSARGINIKAAWSPRFEENQKLTNLLFAGPAPVVDSVIVDQYRRYIEKSQPDAIITCFDNYDLSAFWAGVLSGVPTIAQTLSPWPVCPKGDLFGSVNKSRCDGPSIRCGECIVRLMEAPRIRSLLLSTPAKAPLVLLSAMEMNKFKIVKSKLGHASAIISDNLFLKRKMASLGYNAQKIHVIYNGVDPGIAESTADVPEEKIVLFLAYQTTEHSRALKGCHHFVQLSRNLKPEFPEVRFMWVGQQKIRGDTFETHDYIWNELELQKTYSSSYLLVLPSLWPETMSYAALQAMAHGKPVVAYDTGANREAIVHNETGLLAEWGNINQLTSYVRSLLLDERRTKRMGRNARKLVQEKFTFEQMATKYAKLIEYATNA